MAKVGRHSKLTPERRELILAALSEGNTVRAACGLAHISQQTFYDWMKHKPQFAEDVQAATAVAEREWLQAAQAEATAADWRHLLSLRFRDDWSEKIEIEHSGGVTVTYVNDWRGDDWRSDPPPSTPGTENPEAASQEVQLAAGGEAVAKDDTPGVPGS